MRKTIFLQSFALIAVCVTTQNSFAQLNQLNDGNAGQGNIQSNDGAGSGPGSTAGSNAGTTEELGGVTTEGFGSSAAQDGGIAGGNQTEVFVGGNNSGGFVGGGLLEAFNSNRLFRAITDSQIPMGTTAESGTQRRVPVSLKVAFSYPKSDGTTLLMPAASPITQISLYKPELREVRLNIDGNGVAVLSGNAPTPAASRLAANLIRLRPGVRKIDNRIQVSTP